MRIAVGPTISVELRRGMEYKTALMTGAKPRQHEHAKKALARKPEFPGWHSTDEQEIEHRRIRAGTEPLVARPIETKGDFYGDYAVRSDPANRPYRVQVRALAAHENSCDCMDYRKNGLGTCKHIEAVLLRLRKKGARAFAEAARAGSPYVEICLSRKGEPAVRALWPLHVPGRLKKTLSPFFSSDGRLLAPAEEAVPSLKRALEAAPARVRALVRIGQEVDDWVADLIRRKERAAARETFMADVKAGKRSLDVVKARLYPYQQEGALHLAFRERALLADEMGLGKTVQAIAACEILRRARRVERVLVVSPASLKAEWEEQIAKFTGLKSLIVYGPRARRLKLYREPAFFYLCNYEQAVSDWREMNEVIAPDAIILDEAQRIKNWQTRTARTIKKLAGPYAFVLTGTPLENRIDEVYSIVEFLDPAIFGPLFRFNREFYELDQKGRPVGYKNLDEMHRRLRPVMLRRRKDEVEDQLPPRTVKNFFVGMDSEQKSRYQEYADRVARLLAATKRRPLTREEFEKLQRWLACMRMICDTPFILDPECRICPKLHEVGEVLDDVLASGDSKVLIFSEWERMLSLVRELVCEMKLNFAWHTGSVPQQKRRAEINRFKHDAGCRLFLSTDSGATGLNLQAANVVINLDLPWNPAKLEQRIARAWRKHQTRSVTVINMVCEDSIEHRMLAMLDQKRQLADGVLDGRGDLRAIKMPSGRAALIERMEALMGAPAAEPVATAPQKARDVAAAAARRDPSDTLRQDLLARLDTRLLLLESRCENGRHAFFAVVEGPTEQLRPTVERVFREAFAAAPEKPTLEVLDRQTYETIRRLADAGVLRIDGSGLRTLHSAESVEDAVRKDRERFREAALKILAEARRKGRMSEVLSTGGFVAEALPIMREAVELGLKSLACFGGNEPDNAAAEMPLNIVRTLPAGDGSLPDEAIGNIARLRESARRAGAIPAEEAARLLKLGSELLNQTDRRISRLSLS